MGEFLQNARSGGAVGPGTDELGSVFADDDDNDSAVESGAGLTGMELRNAKAETRRRRWFRRAVWVGKQDAPMPIWQGRSD